MGVRFKAGSVNDPEDKAGLAAMTVRLLDKGTTQRTTLAIADELDFLGAPLEPKQEGRGALLVLGVGQGCRARPRSAGRSVQHARFDAAELERERTQMLSEIHQQRAEPDHVVSQLFRETLYAGHPCISRFLVMPTPCTRSHARMSSLFISASMSLTMRSWSWSVPFRGEHAGAHRALFRSMAGATLGTNGTPQPAPTTGKQAS